MDSPSALMDHRKNVNVQEKPHQEPGDPEDPWKCSTCSFLLTHLDPAPSKIHPGTEFPSWKQHQESPALPKG